MVVVRGKVRQAQGKNMSHAQQTSSRHPRPQCLRTQIPGITAATQKVLRRRAGISITIRNQYHTSSPPIPSRGRTRLWQTAHGAHRIHPRHFEDVPRLCLSTARHQHHLLIPADLGGIILLLLTVVFQKVLAGGRAADRGVCLSVNR